MDSLSSTEQISSPVKPAPHLIEQHIHHQVVGKSEWSQPGVLPEAERVLDGLPLTHGHHVKDVVIGLEGQRDSLCIQEEGRQHLTTRGVNI